MNCQEHHPQAREGNEGNMHNNFPIRDHVWLPLVLVVVIRLFIKLDLKRGIPAVDLRRRSNDEFPLYNHQCMYKRHARTCIAG